MSAARAVTRPLGCSRSADLRSMAAGTCSAARRTMLWACTMANLLIGIGLIFRRAPKASAPRRCRRVVAARR